jgi:hypothetical protein
MCRPRSDLDRHFFADLNFDSFRGLSNSHSVTDQFRVIYCRALGTALIPGNILIYMQLVLHSCKSCYNIEYKKSWVLIG